MRTSLKQKAIAICDTKIAQHSGGFRLAFYAFFQNKNANPELLREAAVWWRETDKLDHFETAVKIKTMVQNQLSARGPGLGSAASVALQESAPLDRRVMGIS